MTHYRIMIQNRDTKDKIIKSIPFETEKIKKIIKKYLENEIEMELL